MKLFDDKSLQAVRLSVRERAARQGGVFRRRDLLEWGLHDSTLQVLLRRGWWMRLRHGVYTDAGVLHGRDEAGRHLLDLAAAIAATDEVTLALGASSALLHALPLPYRSPPEVTVVRDARQDVRSLNRPSRHRVDLPRMRVTSHDLSSCEIEHVGGVPTVNRVVAAVSTAPSLSFTRRVGLFDAILWNRAVSEDEVRTQISEWAFLGKSAELLEALDRARPGAQTFLETLSRLALVHQGLPEPELQVPVYDADGLVGVVDMLWERWRVIGEADGAVKYNDRSDLVAEKRREDRLRALGFSVVRWMWEDITRDPVRVAGQIRRAAQRAA